MNLYFNILLIAAIYVFGIDLCGFWLTISSYIKRIATGGKMRQPFELKPFSCSLCMTFWTGIVYLLAVQRLTIGTIAYICLVAMLTPRIKDLLQLVTDLLAALFNKIRPKE